MLLWVYMGPEAATYNFYMRNDTYMSVYEMVQYTNHLL